MNIGNIHELRRKKRKTPLIIIHKLSRLEILFQPPVIHGLLSAGSAKLSSNISLDMFPPPSQKPTSLATISALSCTCLGSCGSIHSLFTNWILLCFPSRGTSHFMYSISLSSAVKRVVNLFARNSLSRLNARKLQQAFLVHKIRGNKS